MGKFLSDPLAYVGVALTISTLVWYFAGRHAHKSVSWSCCVAKSVRCHNITTSSEIQRG